MADSQEYSSWINGISDLLDKRSTEDTDLYWETEIKKTTRPFLKEIRRRVIEKIDSGGVEIKYKGEPKEDVSHWHQFDWVMFLPFQDFSDLHWHGYIYHVNVKIGDRNLNSDFLTWGVEPGAVSTFVGQNSEFKQKLQELYKKIEKDFSDFALDKSDSNNPYPILRKKFSADELREKSEHPEKLIEEISSNLAGFLNNREEYKKEALELEKIYAQYREDEENDNKNYWWVSQGKNYEKEKQEGILEAPNNGYFKYEMLKNVELGDRVIHNSKGTIKAFSTVIKEHKIDVDPISGEEKIIVEVDYEGIENTPSIQDIQDLFENNKDLLPEKYSPLDKNLNPIEGYFYSFTSEAFELVKELTEKKINLENHNDIVSNKISLNQILYGPPGTGKTWKLREEYAKKFTQYAQEKTREDFERELIKELSWWKVIALVLLKEGELAVPEIRKDRYIKIKENISENKNVGQTIWGMLQMHTSPEFDNVNVKNRSEPFIFEKNPDSEWSILKEECAQKVPELLELHERVENFKSTEEKQTNYNFVTFHQSFNYEDFIEGIKPVMNEESTDSEIEYQIEKGIFKKAVDEACKLAGFDGLKDCLEQSPEVRKEKFENAASYALFIDEINRGNIASIFGELITLIEEDKRLTRENEMRTTLPYSKREFAVPPNLHIIGTMNTADRSVEALDTALRRRFSFREESPDSSIIRKEGDLKGTGGKVKIGEKDVDLSELLNTINSRIEKLLDKDHMIGHSYFLNVQTEKDLKKVFEHNILPLLEEYFYGDRGKIQLILGKSFIAQQYNEISFAENDYEDAGILEDRALWIVKEDWQDNFKMGLDQLLDFDEE